MLKLENLTKKFGSFTAVDNISLEVNSGDLYGFLGENGAGKTTTIKMITGLFSSTSGNILIDGINILEKSVKAKSLIGYVPDQPFLYDKLTGREFLYFSGGLYNLEKKYLHKKIEELIDQLKIDDWIDKRTEEYSQGMRQRITIASALIHNPKIMILDEPMVGLDPQSSAVVKKILREKSSEGTSVFMSTHSLHVAEELCNRIGIIKNGKMIFDGDKARVESLKSSHNSDFESLFLELTK